MNQLRFGRKHSGQIFILYFHTKSRY
jgi:hypothetical protein